MDKSELLAIIEANRDNHNEEFDRAVEVYRGRAVDELQRTIKRLGDGETLDLHFTLPKPVNYSNEYNTVIGMLKHHQGSSITLDYDEYQRFVENKWEWSAHFAANSQVYLAEYE